MKPETLAIKRVRPHIEAAGIYVEKFTPIFRAGTPDLFLESKVKDAFMEAKYINKKYSEGKRISTKQVVDLMSPLQHGWMERRVSKRKPYALFCGFAGEGPRKRTYCFIVPAWLNSINSIFIPKHTVVLSQEKFINTVVGFMLDES